MRLICLLILTFCTFLETGCTSYSAYEKLPPTQKVEIFRDGAKPDRKYREIGMLGDDGRKSEQAGIEGKMIKRAKGMGGNAIIFAPLEQSGAELTPGMVGLADTFTFKAIVIVYE
jgi:hypothetical protein